MSSTRTSKKLKAVTTGLDYGVKSAGATSVFLNALGFCIIITNPVILAIAGAVGTIFCCLGTCYDWRQSDNDEEFLDIERKMEKKLDRMEKEIIHVAKVQETERNHFIASNSSLFEQKRKEHKGYVVPGPIDMKMDDDIKIKRSQSYKL